MEQERFCCNCKYDACEVDEEPCVNCKNNFPPSSVQYATAPFLWEAITENNNSVDHPSHYNQGNIECIDAMIAAFGKEAVATFCHINAFKYIWRSEHKGGIQDIDKAIWYLNKVMELSTNE